MKPSDVVIIGAGFAGLYALHKLRSEGYECRVLERGSGVGGVWHWNRYPGARVDVESIEYSFNFSEELEQEWHWPERYSAQPEIEAYANFVADKFKLRPDIQLDTEVISCHFDEQDAAWRVTTRSGDQFVAQFLVMATGSLSEPKEIDLPGIERFQGEIYRTNRWPHDEVRFEGKRVGEIGTGSSGIQVVPEIAKTAAHLTVFQRTAAFAMPSNNGPTDPVRAQQWFDDREAMYKRQRASHSGLVLAEIDPRSALSVSDKERRQAYEMRWEKGGLSIIGTFNDLLLDLDANTTCSQFVSEKIAAAVDDQETAKKLVPTTHPIFTRRPCVENGYFRAFNRPNVSLVDIRENPIETITETGLIAGGQHYELDMLVLAIGFDAMTGAMNRIDIRGRDGMSLKHVWDSEGPVSYLGLAVAGFPNMFTVSGPGSPSVLANQIGAFEYNADWFSDLFGYMRSNGIRTAEATAEAQSDWGRQVYEAAVSTLYHDVDSWYTGSNVAGKKRMFVAYVGGWSNYLDICDAVAANRYRGFKLQQTEAAV